MPAHIEGSEAADLRPPRPRGALRSRVDRLLVLVVLIAIWVVLAAVFGSYWVGSPWGVATRLGTAVWSDIWQALGFVLGPLWSDSAVGAMTRPGNMGLQGQLQGQILLHASYTLFEAVAGFLLGAIPAAALPFLLRRLPLVTAIIDPFMVGGYGAPKLALAPLFILWFGIGI
jgi:NitT/TauT family transport system permease protein